MPAPTTIVAGIASQGDHCQSNSIFEIVNASRPYIAPIERSISPAMKRKVIPVAMIVSSEICMATRRMLSSVKKVSGRAMESTTKSPIAAARMPNSRIWNRRRSRSCPGRRAGGSSSGSSSSSATVDRCAI